MKNYCINMNSYNMTDNNDDIKIIIDFIASESLQICMSCYFI